MGDCPRCPQRPQVTRRIVLGVLLAVVVLQGETARASEGLLLMGNSPIQASRAGAGVASPRDSSWAMTNPASIVKLERRLDLNLFALRPDVGLEARGIGGNPMARDINCYPLGAIPSGGLIWPLEEGTLGLAMLAPCGLDVEFPKSRNILWFLQGNGDRRARFLQTRLVLAYARELGQGWSAGLSVNGSLSLLRTDHETPFLMQTRGDLSWDEAFGGGFSAGVFKEWDRLSVGVSYQSQQWTQQFQKYKDLFWYSIDLPEVIQAGFAYKLTPKLELVADYKMAPWSQTRIFGRRRINGGLDWNDQNAAKIGLEWAVNERWTARAGFSHSTSAVDSHTAFTSALVPNLIVDQVAVGFTHALSKTSELHVTYARCLENHVTGTPRGDFYSLIGGRTEVSLAADELVLGYTLKF